MSIRVGPVRSSASAPTVPGWRPEDFHRLLTNVFEEGIVQSVGSGLAVVQRAAGANMSVDVGIGLALIEYTTTLLSPNETIKTWFHNDAVVNVAITTADATNPRKDRVIAKIDATIDPDGNSSNIGTIVVLAGTPAGSPTPPATPSNAISLAVVDVPASDTTIATAQITDDRPLLTLQSTVLLDVQREATALKKTRLQFNDFTELTIASGVVTTSQPLHRIDTEADAASDDLVTITAGYGAGETVILRAENTARTVVVKHGTGNIFLVDGADFSLDDSSKTLTLVRTGSNWTEVSRAAAGTALTYHKRVDENYVDSTLLTNPTAQTDFDNHTTSIPANDLVAGVVYRARYTVNVTHGVAGTYTLCLNIAGGGLVPQLQFNSMTGTNIAAEIEVTLWGTAAAGAAASVRYMIKGMKGFPSIISSGTIHGAANLATNGAITLTPAALFGTSNGGNTTKVVASEVDKYSSTPFPV